MEIYIFLNIKLLAYFPFQNYLAQGFCNCDYYGRFSQSTYGVYYGSVPFKKRIYYLFPNSNIVNTSQHVKVNIFQKQAIYKKISL